MIIEKILTSRGISGYFNKDLAAIKAGAVPDGLTYCGTPRTPGFHAVTQPGEALSIMLLLKDGQVAWGDCVDVVFTGAAGRDPIFKAQEQEQVIEQHIAPSIQGKRLNRFRDLADSIDDLEVSGRKLHTATRYGLTQALLDGVAKAHRLTMTETIASEYGCTPANRPVPLLGCATNQQKLDIDKLILKKIPLLPHGNTSNLARDLGTSGEKLLEYVRWLVGRIQTLRSPDYNPTIHLDVYGTIGEAFHLEVPRIADYLGVVQEACAPFPIIIETPVIADSREKQIQIYRELRENLKNEGNPGADHC